MTSQILTAADGHNNQATSLRAIIKSAGKSMADFTVMSGATDPYRIDTEANHRDAKWLAEAWAQCKLTSIHNRGLHYALVSLSGLIKPNGERYKNTDDDWVFLQRVSGYARWLGHLDFDSITDERNAGPELYLPPEYDQTGIQVIHDADYLDMAPTMPEIKITCQAPHARQAYRLVLIGEKSSLRTLLRSICQRFEAELVLPTGELSTTLLYGIVSRAAADGRPCRIFYLSDFDPSGIHMPVEVARKIQALCDLKFPGLDIELHRCALLAAQVKELGLPETPLKESERRADRWRERFQCEQTEIDALATLRSETLVTIVERDLAPYFDSTLQKRQTLAFEMAKAKTQGLLGMAMAPFEQELVHTQGLIDDAAVRLAAAYRYAMPLFDTIAQRIECFEPATVEPDLPGSFAAPLFSSRNSFAVTTAALLGEKL